MTVRSKARKVRRLVYAALLVAGIAVLVPAVDGATAAAREWSPADTLEAFARWATSHDSDSPAPTPQGPAPSFPTPTTSGGLVGPTVTVGRVVDGDTVELSDGRTLRLVGVDTPENQRRDRGTPWCLNRAASDNAKAHVIAWLDATSWDVHLNSIAEDQSGRRDLAARVQLMDGTDLSERLLAENLGRTWPAPSPTDACPYGVDGGQPPSK